MSLIFEKRNVEKLENGSIVKFNLLLYENDFTDKENDENSYICNIVIVDNNNDKIDSYYRLFKIDSFSEEDYNCFISQFCRNHSYREQFNVKNQIIEKRNTDAIDEEIKEVIELFNKMGLITNYSCQGTKDKYSDRPCKRDGHSILAYISFVNDLPNKYKQILKNNKELRIYENKIYATKRKYNCNFSKKYDELFN